MSDSKIRFNSIREPASPAANRVWLWYDEDDRIFKIKRDDGIAEPLVGGSIVTNTTTLKCLVRNVTGATIPKGSLVYINGASGNRPTITYAQSNNNEADRTFGFTETDILHNATGYVVVEGQLQNINTNSFTEGDLLYLSDTTPGGFTSVKPTSPSHLVFVGHIVRAHPNLGVIEVRIKTGLDLGDVCNVLIGSLSDGQALVYDASTQLWKNQTIVVPPSNIYTVEYFTLDSLNISSSSITLSHTPTDATSVTLDVISGSAQVYGEDYNVSLNVLSWVGTPLYDILEIGDKLRITYTK